MKKKKWTSVKKRLHLHLHSSVPGSPSDQPLPFLRSTACLQFAQLHGNKQPNPKHHMHAGVFVVACCVVGLPEVHGTTSSCIASPPSFKHECRAGRRTGGRHVRNGTRGCGAPHPRHRRCHRPSRPRPRGMPKNAFCVWVVFSLCQCQKCGGGGSRARLVQATGVELCFTCMRAVVQWPGARTVASACVCACLPACHLPAHPCLTRTSPLRDVQSKTC